jgi:uncharacterized DUF497 family protein
MTFEWDENKNIENIEKHNVSFDEAKEAFDDLNVIIFEDTQHSFIEQRYFCIGKTKNGTITVRFTIRNQKIRIIGAGYWRKEKKIYETKNNLY